MSVILCNLSDAKAVIEEEKINWIFKIFDYLNIPKETFDYKTLDEYRENMNNYGIEVELSTNGEVNVFKKTWFKGKTKEQSGWLPTEKNNLIAQWKEPTYKKIIDSNNVYYEIHLNEWSIINMRKI